jgi:hypothetical protein
MQKLTPYELWEQRRNSDEVQLYENCDNCGTWVEIHVRSGLVGRSDADYEQYAITRKMPQRRRGPSPPATAV